jgi:hypothetical protein
LLQAVNAGLDIHQIKQQHVRALEGERDMGWQEQAKVRHLEMSRADRDYVARGLEGVVNLSSDQVALDDASLEGPRRQNEQEVRARRDLVESLFGELACSDTFDINEDIDAPLG